MPHPATDDTAGVALAFQRRVSSLVIFTRSGRTGVRAALTVVLLIAAWIWLTNLQDGGVPGLIRALDGAAMALTLVAIVLAWLPATRRFARDSKAARRG